MSETPPDGKGPAPAQLGSYESALKRLGGQAGEFARTLRELHDAPEQVKRTAVNILKENGLENISLYWMASEINDPNYLDHWPPRS
ncbi:hypothetical protein ACJBCE_00485 [Streptomyces sp. NBUL23]|uniref:hypothetical protein n=1 Tax=Streptomyces sp. NBUL23 TaxID=3381354 RepID=UPI003872A3A7